MQPPDGTRWLTRRRVGKTATTLGLASAISHRGGRALVVDMDPRPTPPRAWVSHTADGQLTTADLMDRTEPGSAIDAVVATAWDGIDLIPSPGPVQRRDPAGPPTLSSASILPSRA